MHLDTATRVGEKIDDDAMEFGQLYLSKGIDGANKTLPRAIKPDEWISQPGTYLPYVWTIREGKRVPILDVVGQGKWTLISEANEWDKVVFQVNKKSPIALTSLQIGRDIKFIQQGEFQELFGISGSRAALIRPDGYITWRVKELPANTDEVLDGVLSRVTFRIAVSIK